MVSPALGDAFVFDRYSVFSYGGGGGDAVGRRQKYGENVTSSRVRESIRSLVPLFVDLFVTGHEEAARRIREERIDILVDLQGHTLGGRSEIVAARPSPIQVDDRQVARRSDECKYIYTASLPKRSRRVYKHVLGTERPLALAMTSPDSRTFCAGGTRRGRSLLLMTRRCH